MTEVLYVEGMTSNQCVSTIEGVLKELDVWAQVDIKNSIVSVEFDEGRVTLEEIKEAISSVGYYVL